MSDLKAQISEFKLKCEEIKSCKFIMATTKIKDLLKCIVNCPDVYRLFEAVTADFNYPAVKSKCLVTVNDGVFTKSYVVLPKTVGQRLAFIFCLFVEFDRDTVNFNDFLRVYFPEDGSYYASYRAFCGMIVQGMSDALEQALGPRLAKYEEGDEAAKVAPNPAKAEYLSLVLLSIARECNFLSESKISEEDKAGGLGILSQLAKAVKSEDGELIDALVCGYNYFVLYHKCVSDGIAPLIGAIAEYEKTL